MLTELMLLAATFVLVVIAWYALRGLSRKLMSALANDSSDLNMSAIERAELERLVAESLALELMYVDMPGPIPTLVSQPSIRVAQAYKA